MQLNSTAPLRVPHVMALGMVLRRICGHKTKDRTRERLLWTW